MPRLQLFQGQIGSQSQATPPLPVQPDQGFSSSLGSVLGALTERALYNPAADPHAADAAKSRFELQEAQDTAKRGDAAAAEMAQVMSGATAQMKSLADPSQRHAILADAITQASLIGQKYQVPPTQFAHGFTQWLNASDPEGTLAAAFMNGSSGAPQAAGTFYNEGQRQGEAATASALKKQEGDQSYRQAMDVQGLTNTGSANVANITGGYGVKEAGIHAGAEVKSAGISAGATVRAAGIHEAGETGRNSANLAVNAPLRAAQAGQATAAAQDSVTNVMTKLVSGSGVTNRDVPAVVSRATRYAADGAPTANAVARAIQDLHQSGTPDWMGIQDRMAPYPARAPLAPARPASAAAGKRPPLASFQRQSPLTGIRLRFDAQGGQIR